MNIFKSTYQKAESGAVFSTVSWHFIFNIEKEQMQDRIWQANKSL